MNFVMLRRFKDMGRDYYIFSNGRIKRKENTIYFIDEQENK